jgi:methylase of polypeptide subunit release factors
MKMKIHSASLAAIRDYLNEMMYSLVDLRLSFEIGLSPTGFPKFQSLQQIVNRLDPAHQVLFRLFRLGETVDDASVKESVPDRILTALTETEVLIKDEAGGWRTPSLLIVPAEGLLLVVNIPPSYPTASKPCNVWFDMSSFFVAKALPTYLGDKRVLDVCSGSGLQSLLCAARGATQVLGLELHEEAVIASRANAILNGVDGRVEFRQSNVLASLEKGERFDFVVCNTPYAPVIEGPGAPSSLEEIGNSVLLRLLRELQHHLSERSRGILGTWRAIGHQSSTYLMQSIGAGMKKDGFDTFAYVDRAPDTLDGVLRILQTDLEQRAEMQPDRINDIVESVRNLFQKSERPVDGFYNQLIYFQRGKIESATAGQVIFGLSAPVQA